MIYLILGALLLTVIGTFGGRVFRRIRLSSRKAPTIVTAPPVVVGTGEIGSPIGLLLILTKAA